MDVNHFMGARGPLDAQVHGIWERQLEDWITRPRFRALWDSGAIQRFTTEHFCDHVRAKLAARLEARD